MPKTDYSKLISELGEKHIRDVYSKNSIKKSCEILNIGIVKLTNIVSLLKLSHDTNEIRKLTIQFNPTFYSDRDEKIKKTRLERYGDENYCNSEKAVITRESKYESREEYNKHYTEVYKQTLSNKYGSWDNYINQHSKQVSNTAKNRTEEEKKLVGEHISDALKNPQSKNAQNRAFQNALSNQRIFKNSIEFNFEYLCIFDWDDVNLILQRFIIKDTIYARKCEIKELGNYDTVDFLNMNHLQGYCNGQQICLGLFYNDELVQIMTFGKPRYNKNYQYELIRLCTKLNTKVIGGTEKLFKYFLNNYAPDSIISYCDNAKFKGDIYNRLGFSLKSYGNPSKHWYNIKTEKHITDNLLRQRGFDQLFGTDYGKGTSNEQLMLDNGFVEIYDCGQSVYVYNKEQK